MDKPFLNAERRTCALVSFFSIIVEKDGEEEEERRRTKEERGAGAPQEYPWNQKCSLSLLQEE